MTSGTTVTNAFTSLRDAIGTLADKVTDINQESKLRDRAFAAGNLGEQCQTRFAGGEVPSGNHAVQDAQHATALAGSANAMSGRDLDRVNAAADRANETLNAILSTARGAANFSEKIDIPLEDLPGPEPTGSAEEARGQEGLEVSDAAIAIAVAAALAAAALMILPLLLLRRPKNRSMGHRA